MKAWTVCTQHPGRENHCTSGFCMECWLCRERRLMLNVVPESAPVRITVTGPLEHTCPHVQEVDHGTITIAWTCGGATLELHSLAAYLQWFAGVPVTHEIITDQIRGDLADIDGITDVTVTTTWTTAQLDVRVEAMP